MYGFTKLCARRTGKKNVTIGYLIRNIKVY